MTENKRKKQFFAKHAKSSALMVSLAIHGILILVAVSFVAVTVINKEETKFEAKQVSRPKQKLKKLQVPVKVQKQKPKPKLRKRVVVKNVQRKTPEFKMPEITGVKSGLGSLGDGSGGMESIGFTMPEIDFFGAKAKGEKVVFVVHFGPATITEAGKSTPFTRMTGLTIRNRLEDLVGNLPEYTLFNVISFFWDDAWAMEPAMQLATPENKQKVNDWMETVNPLKGGYVHCFSIGKGDARKRINAAYKEYPKRVENISSHSPKWAYPYNVPKELEEKYAPNAPGGIMHWSRGVAWAILEQKADTIFLLTTNYDDGWKTAKGGSHQPDKMAQGLQQMCKDVYGADRKKWPTINVVVLNKAGKDLSGANKTLNERFYPIVRAFGSQGSIIKDITDYMNEEEKKLYDQYRLEYAD